MPDAGSHITIDLRPEPCRARAAASTSLVWNCDLPQLLEARARARATAAPASSSGSSTSRDRCAGSRTVLAAAAARARARTPGTGAGSRGARRNRKVVSPNGVVIENWRSVPPSSVKRWMSSMDVPPRSSSSANVRSMSSTSNTSVPTPSGCFAEEAPGAPALADRLAGARTARRRPGKHAERCWPCARARARCARSRRSRACRCRTAATARGRARSSGAFEPLMPIDDDATISILARSCGLARRSDQCARRRAATAEIGAGNQLDLIIAGRGPPRRQLRRRFV